MNGPALAERTPVEDASQVSTARAMAVRVGGQAGLPPRLVDSLALVATELAENLHRHAHGGELIVVPPYLQGGGRLSLLAVDRGPGVQRFEDCLVDGYSTAGTLGTGLGAVQRIADDFDAVSEPGLGTVVDAGFAVPGSRAAGPTHFDVGAVGFPIEGEYRNGDAYGTVRHGAHLTVMLADGLGHGDGAATASNAATAELAVLDERSPSRVVSEVSQRIRGTRGAALSVADLELDVARAGGELRSAGLGNVTVAVVRPDGEIKRVAASYGTAGTVQRRAPMEQRTAFPARGLLVLHSDGLTSRWTLAGRTELLRHRAEIVAAVLWRDHARLTDDSLVVVVRAAPTRSVS